MKYFDYKLYFVWSSPAAYTRYSRGTYEPYHVAAPDSIKSGVDSFRSLVVL